MWMLALRPWVNREYEGVVSPGQRFEAGALRAGELERAGLAIPAASETAKIKVKADSPLGSPPMPVPESTAKRRKSPRS